MRLRLLVMRHAKSSWKSDAPTDHARPLNKRGRAAAPTVAQRIHELGWDPLQVFSSDAQRTRETWSLAAPQLQAPGLVRFTSRLYSAAPQAAIAVLGDADDALDTTLVLGHNPCCEGLVAWLSGESVVMKTADVALLEVDASGWKPALARQHSWRLSRLLRAR